MKNNIKILCLLSVVLLGLSCSKTDNVTDKNTMRFSALYPNKSKATSSGFEQKDTIGVYVTQYDGAAAVPLQLSGNYANNIAVVYDGSVWKSLIPIYWATGKFDVYAYYPYIKPTSVDSCPFAISQDQSTVKSGGVLGGYEASDFLWAQKTGVEQMASVPLTFKHIMSKLIINLIKGPEYTGELPSDAVVYIHNTVPYALIDLTNGSATKNSNESVKSITAMKISDSQYTAIIVPQRIDRSTPLIEINSKDVSYLIETSFVFRAGYQYTINITLNQNPDQVDINIGGQVDNW